MVVDQEELGLELVRWGSRFANAGTETRYRAWQEDGAVQFNRAGLLASLGSWLLLAVLLITAWPEGAGRALAWLGLVVIPVILVGLVPTSQPRFRSLMQPTVMLANCVAGLYAVMTCYWILHLPDLASGTAITIGFFGFAIFRLRPLQGAAAVAPYVFLASLLNIVEWRAGRYSGPHALLWVGGLLIPYVVGALISVVIDAVSRQSYRMGRIIEAQKVTIAAERARSEALMQREISHQVAERSRELGASLARMDSALDAGSLAPGDLFDGRYRVLRMLGAGGMGVVYEVERTTDGRALALKIMTGRVSGSSAARFAREAEIGARVHHANLVSIVDVGFSTGAPFLVMELVAGVSLEDLRADFGSAAWALPILHQMAAGVAALHEAGVVHRDLKPANVLVSTVEGELIARISDFGISRFGESGSSDPRLGLLGESSSGRGAGLTTTGALLGTPFYMPPEAALGAHRVEVSGDVFSFGLIAYEMLTGKVPFEQPAVMLAFAGVALPAVPPIETRGVGQSLARLLVECLHADPERRPRMAGLCAVLGAATGR